MNKGGSKKAGRPANLRSTVERKRESQESKSRWIDEMPDGEEGLEDAQPDPDEVRVVEAISLGESLEDAVGEKVDVSDDVALVMMRQLLRHLDVSREWTEDPAEYADALEDISEVLLEFAVSMKRLSDVLRLHGRIKS